MGAVVVVRRDLGRLVVVIEWCCFVEAAGWELAQRLVSRFEEQQVQILEP